MDQPPVCLQLSQDKIIVVQLIFAVSSHNRSCTSSKSLGRIFVVTDPFATRRISRSPAAGPLGGSPTAQANPPPPGSGALPAVGFRDIWSCTARRRRAADSAVRRYWRCSSQSGLSGDHHAAREAVSSPDRGQPASRQERAGGAPHPRQVRPWHGHEGHRALTQRADTPRDTGHGTRDTGHGTPSRKPVAGGCQPSSV